MSWDMLGNAQCGKDGKQRIEAVTGCVGWQAKFVIDAQGNLYAAGSNYQSSTGFDYEHDDTPAAPLAPDYPLRTQDELEEIILFAQPPGTEKLTWRWVEAGEHHTFALTTEGKLYVAGAGYAEVFGLPGRSYEVSHGTPDETWDRHTEYPDDIYDDYPTFGVFTPLFPDRTWKQISGKCYGVFGIDMDDNLWVWGYNPDGECGVLNDYWGVGYPGEDYGPRLHPLFIDIPVKWVSTDLYTGVIVTMDDRVFQTGYSGEIFCTGIGSATGKGPEIWPPEYLDGSNWLDGVLEGRIADPPVGASIIQAIALYNFTLILYDNGDLYCACWSPLFWDAHDDGYTVGWDYGAYHKMEKWAYIPVGSSRDPYDYDNGQNFPETCVQVATPFIVSIDNWEEWSTAYVRDSEGNVWAIGGGWGRNSFLYVGSDYQQGDIYDKLIYPPEVSQSEGQYDYKYSNTLCFSKYPGEKGYRFAGHVGFYDGGMCIDNAGFVFCMGSNWSSRLGLGYIYSYGGAYYHYTPALAPPFVNDYHTIPYIYEYSLEQMTGVNYLPIRVSPYMTPEEQLKEHEECGHWHPRRHINPIKTYSNCWMPAVAVSNSRKIYLFVGGRWEKSELLFLEYDVARNIWTWLYESEADLEGFSAAQYSAAFIGELMYRESDGALVFYNGFADTVESDLIQVVAQNFRMICCILKDGVMNKYEFPGSNFESGRYKMGVDGAGGIYLVAHYPLSSLKVWRTLDDGTTWEMVYEVPWSSDIIDWGIAVRPDLAYGYMCFFILKSNRYVDNHWSSTSGDVWTLRSNDESFSSTVLPYELICYATEDWFFVGVLAEDRTLLYHKTTATSQQYDGMSGGLHNPAFATAGTDTVQVYGNLAFRWPISDDQLREEILVAMPLAGQVDIDGNHSGMFAYAAFNTYTLVNGVKQYAVGISEDSGEHWVARGAPLSWKDRIDEVVHDIMFTLAKEPWAPTEKFLDIGPKFPKEKYGYAGSEAMTAGDDSHNED